MEFHGRPIVERHPQLGLVRIHHRQLRGHWMAEWLRQMFVLDGSTDRPVRSHRRFEVHVSDDGVAEVYRAAPVDSSSPHVGV